MRIIARIRTDLPDKFGVPRQSGMINELTGKIVFEPEYRVPEAVRGLECYRYIWLIWNFSEAENENWSPTVRPPRLGGNTRMGVFATRSPNRPNPIGLSAVKLEKVIPYTDEGPVLIVSGIDLIDNTPIYDIKPYLEYADCKTGAGNGFADAECSKLKVLISCDLLELIPEEKRTALIKILEEDPRPGYHNDPDRMYGFHFAGFEVRFIVDNNELTVEKVEKISQDIM